jgi:hypothetical protein
LPILERDVVFGLEVVEDALLLTIFGLESIILGVDSLPGIFRILVVPSKALDGINFLICGIISANRCKIKV